jgi:hypothetical protein
MQQQQQQQEEEEEEQQQQQRPPCTHTLTHSHGDVIFCAPETEPERGVLISDRNNIGAFYIPYKATRGNFTLVIVLHYTHYVQEKNVHKKN